MTGPLSGIRVLDLTHFVAGPWCTMMLADLGAEVTKIEPLSGEIGRAMGGVYAQGESAIFLGFNRGKRSVALDLKMTEGVAIVQRLAAETDIVVQNFRPGTAERLGVDAGLLRTRHPSLIYCAISAFGSDGPYASRPANDPVIQALSGAMSATAGADGAPVRMGVSLPDLSAGVLAATAILAAVHRRAATGVGSSIDLNLLDTQMFSQTDLLTTVLRAEASTPPVQEEASVRGTYFCEDGLALWIDLDNAEQVTRAVWQSGGSSPVKAPQDASDAGTARSRVTAEILALPREAWIKILTAAGVSCAPVMALGDVLPGHPDRTVHTLHPTIGQLRQVRTPITVNPSWPVVDIPPPLLGEHTRDILERLGIEAVEIDRLAAEGVLRDGTGAAN